MFEDKSFKRSRAVFSLVLREIIDGFKFKTQVVGWPALLVVKNEVICRYAQGNRKILDRFERGLCFACFVPAQLYNADACSFS